jgi:hypothetical protein
VPAAQSEQADAAAAENLPVWQSLQVVEDTAEANLPALQFVQVIAPDAENVPSPQVVHAVPSAFRMVPVPVE